MIQDLAHHVIGGDALISFPQSLTEAPTPGVQHSWILDIAHGEEWDESRKTLRACCELTRTHVELSVEYNENVTLQQHCQVNDKLHHFQCIYEQNVQSSTYDGFTFSCSRCSTNLAVKIRKPEIPDATIQSLYSVRPSSLYSKPITGAQTGPSRFSTLSGIEYLLRKTVAFDEPAGSAMLPREIEYKAESIFARLVGLEPEVTKIMRDCMFRLAPGDWDRLSWYDEKDLEDEMLVDGIEWAYFPSDPRSPGVRDKYRRLRLELQILACEARKSLSDHHRDRVWSIQHARAEKYMKQIMDAADNLYTSNQFQVDERSAEEPCYSKLGCTASCRDAVLTDFLELQVKHDQHKQSYYLTSLELIGKARKSDILLLEVSKQKSMGLYTLEDVSDAYRLLGDDPDEDDETLVNLAASIMLDDEVQKHKARTALEIIGKERDSAVIRKYLNTPDKDFADVASALLHLGADSTTEDEFLLILYDMKAEENQRLARSALETIAEERKNVRLKRFLDTGDRNPPPSVSFDLTNTDDVEMLDPDLAYSRLGVDDRTIDDDMLIMLYEIRCADEPEEAAALKKALEVIGDTRSSSAIRTFVASGTKEAPVKYEPPPASTERPTGIENIGNTCYLNSLLQYYFTIKPLREAVLNMDQYVEQELTEELLSRKKVGGRLVTRDEIERALRFISELRQLFRSLITSPKSSLKPAKSLCFLALVSHKDEPKPNLSQLEKGTGLSLQADENNQLISLTKEVSDPMSIVGDDGLPETRSPKRKASDISLLTHDHEDDPPIRSEDVMSEHESPKALSPSIDHGEVTKKAKTVEKIVDDFVWTDIPDGDEAIDQPGDLIDAPKFSRRQNNRRKSSVLFSESNDWGKQQDVAECVDNCLFQLEAALKPSAPSEADGEQMDLVKNLFYGRTKQRLDVADNTAKEERFSNTIVTLDKEGQDVYHALDGVFDERQVELGGKQVKLNLTIAQAPPFLQIQIQRAAFDLKSMSAIKSNIYLALDQTIFLDRYMDTDNDMLLAKREEYWQLKRDLARTEEVKAELVNMLAASEVAGPPTPDHIWSATANEVHSEDDDIAHIENVEDVPLSEVRRGSVKLIKEDSISLTHEELEIALRASTAQEESLTYKIAHAFDDHLQHEYLLHSVFIHRGEATHGHYWIYIYDFQLDKWRKYNDEEVTDVSKSEVFKDRRNMNENPYMLTYLRKDQIGLTAALDRDFERSWEEQSLI